MTPAEFGAALGWPRLFRKGKRFGVWGGLSERQRRALRRAVRR